MKTIFSRYAALLAALILILPLPALGAQTDDAGSVAALETPLTEAAAPTEASPSGVLAAEAPAPALRETTAPEGTTAPEAASPLVEASGLAELAELAEEVSGEVRETTGRFGFRALWQRLVAAAVIVVVQILAIWLIWHFFFTWLNKKVIGWGRRTIKPLTIKKLKLLTVAQILNVIAFLVRILKYLVTAFQLFITLPAIFSLFPQTQHIASQLVGYILHPLGNIVFGTIGYVPNLIAIIIILWVTRYVIRAMKFFATQIERERLVIPGFYPDWAQPTFNILRVLVYAFTVVIIYPYLPGSGSPIFQGVSVFVGIIFSLGSSSAIGNIVAGLVITYMRPFKIGDRIQIGTLTGFVVEKSLIVIKLRTHKNEYVTFPNTMILNSSITNYSTSGAEESSGVILHADVTMNYQVPWRTVETIMIDAALKTTGLESEPRPWVLQTGLEDFYARYQINAHTKDADRTPAIYAELYRNLQDGFADEGIDLTAPIYRINLPPSSHTPPVKKGSPPAGEEAEGAASAGGAVPPERQGAG
jgi:small-conductance mechanosensitive channel